MRLLWGENPWTDIQRACAEGYIVVLPCGAVEQHGPMLPVDTDARLAERWAIEGSALARDKYGVKVLVLPTLFYGQSCHHMNFPGTISLSFPTYLAVLCDVMREVIRHGFVKIAIVNGNGGNDAPIRCAQYQVMEELERAGKKVRISLFPNYESRHIAAELKKLRESGIMPDEGNLGIHAAGTETAETLADRPELVVREACVRPQLKRDTVPDWAWRTEELSDTGAFGDPSLATAEWGQALWSIWAEAIAQFLSQFAAEG
jgi:creatinine amidohydrolase